MRNTRFTRRDVLKGSAALAGRDRVRRSRCARRRRRRRGDHAALIEAAKKEGKSPSTPRWTSISRSGSARRSRQKYPGIAVRVERSGAERVFTAHRPGIQRQHLRRRRRQHRRRRALHHLEAQRLARAISAGGGRASTTTRPTTTRTGFSIVTRILVSPIAYNTNLVKKEDAPKSFNDLLDPKWAGKMVKGASGL